ncbi:MAG: hypothetical protein ABJK39_05860 [Hyphomicrobiales bacterium]
MSDDKLDAILERLDLMQYDIGQLEARMDSVENELRLMTHEHAPQIKEMRLELTQMKKFMDSVSEVSDGGTPIEAMQPPPRR